MQVHTHTQARMHTPICSSSSSFLCQVKAVVSWLSPNLRCNIYVSAGTSESVRFIASPPKKTCCFRRYSRRLFCALPPSGASQPCQKHKYTDARAHTHTHTHTHIHSEYKSVCALIRNAICNESERASERHKDRGRQTDRGRQIDRHRRVYFLAKRRAIFSSRVSFSFVFFFGSLPLSSSEESLLQKPHGIIILIIEHTLAGGRFPAAP